MITPLTPLSLSQGPLWSEPTPAEAPAAPPPAADNAGWIVALLKAIRLRPRVA